MSVRTDQFGQKLVVVKAEFFMVTLWRHMDSCRCSSHTFLIPALVGDEGWAVHLSHFVVVKVTEVAIGH
jgi:hypothetical protein